MEPCSHCGMRHTKAALAEALGVDVNARVGASTKILRMLTDAEMTSIWNRIDGGLTPAEAVAQPIAPIGSQAPSNAPAGSVEEAIRNLIAATGGKANVDTNEMREYVDDRVASLFSNWDSKLDKRIAELEAKLQNAAPREIVVKIDGGPGVKIEGAAHELLETAVKLLKLHRLLVLVGPSGSGKSVLANQALKAVGCERLAQLSGSSGLSEWHFVGRVNPATGNYSPTPFVETWREGGGILLDEIDGIDPNVLVSANEALANGRLATPANADSPFVQRHETTYVIATANTWGHGGDRMYVGRNQLDATTLDRFGGGASRLHVDYSEAVEKSVCPDATIRDWAKRVRKNIASKGLRRLVTTRFLAAAHREVSSKAFTWEETRERFFLGWPANERSTAEASGY